MQRAVIAIVDAAHARIFAYEEGADPTLQLHELQDLSSAGRQLRVGETVSNTEPGRSSASDGPALSANNGGQTHTRGYERSATDDHRDAKVEEMDSKFAKQVVQAVDALINQDGYRHVIVAAGPKMLGALRNADGVLSRADLQVEEIPKVLTTLSVAQLHDHLAAQGLVPPRRRLAAAR